jgi:acetylornithine aminotransferase
MLDGGLYGPQGRVARISQYFRDKLAGLAKTMPDTVAGPFGYGAMIVFTPFDGSRERSLQLAKDLFSAGVLCFMAGSDPTRIRFLIPVAVVTEADIDAVIAIIAETMRA